MTSLITIIPTLGRHTLQRSLESISNQTKIPDQVLIVSNNKIEHRMYEGLKLTYLQNNRTKTLSGAVNTALAYCLNQGLDPEQTYISILDDDDEWEPTYLQKCFDRAIERNVDQIITGIIRHTSKTESEKLEIPGKIDPDIFLTKNPHIQGSNLFVKFSKILEAGSYDERLQSTTDRDICYRLFELDHTYEVLKEHLVHHWALKNQNRLSDAGSPKKSSGLNAFYQKYSLIMTQNQKEAFKERAKSLFQITIDPPYELKEPKKQPQKESDKYFPIIIGFFSSNLKTTEELVKDIKLLFQNYPTHYQVVVCDNSKDTDSLRNLLGTHLDHFKFYNKSQINQDCDSGLFGSYLIDPENRKGIASGRTILHRYIYDEMKNTPGSIAWVLDDDIRLESLQIDGTTRKIAIDELNTSILSLKTQGIPIANGKITGEPPIPFLSTVRTQLLDLHYNLKKIKRNTCEEVNQSIFSENYDYYYDLSETNYTHLETPEYLNKIRSIDNVETWINTLLTGSNLSRPIVDYPQKIAPKIPPRGGNTLILNPKSIRDYPNISPRIGDTSFRRGDRFWCTLNYYHGGRKIAESPVSVKQTRTMEKDDAFSYSRLESDFYGSSFVKAMDEYYHRMNEELGWNPRRIRLSFSDESLETIVKLFREHLQCRVSNFIMNAYRIRGLIHNIKKQLDYTPDILDSVLENLDYLEAFYSIDNINKFRKSVFDINNEELEQFIRNLKKYVKSYREPFSTEITKQEIAHSKTVLLKIGLVTSDEKVDLLGFGNEGAVFTNRKQVFKVFHYGKTEFPEHVYDYLTNKMLNNERLTHFTKLEKIIEKDGELVFVFPYEKYEQYQGGYLKDIQNLLRESKKERIAVSNIHPKNFVIANGVLKHVDIGKSIIPFSEKEYLQMCKRAYLTYRWHFRKDISKLMETAIFNEDIPELFGFSYFIKSQKTKTKENTLDKLVIDRIISNAPGSVLDYGCGKGKISEELSKLGYSVVGYDIDFEQIDENRIKKTLVEYVTPEGLSSYGKFDQVLCCLVLCTIESDIKVTQVVRDLRKHVDDSGRVFVVICNPYNTFVKETETHIKHKIPSDTSYSAKISYTKLIKETGSTRRETHRPFSYYQHLFHCEGFQISEIIESKSADVNELAPASDFMIIELKPIAIPLEDEVTLLIKVSAMEWKSIDFQIRHIINQLEGPKRFKEKIVVTDNHNGPYLRQYTDPNLPILLEKLELLQDQGVIDRVLVVEENPDEIRSTMNKWFDQDTLYTRCSNGQPTYTILKGIEEIDSTYFLQLDSDCLFSRKDRGHDYLKDMIMVLESDETAISVSFNIAHEEDIDYTHGNREGPWRVETRCSLIHKPRLVELLPLPNQLDTQEQIKYPWHRSLDQASNENNLHNYRGGDNKTFYIHLPNEFKSNTNEWYNIVRAVERGHIPSSQYEKVDLQNVSDWLNPVDSEFVILVRGLNVPISKLRRCIESIQDQTYDSWKIIFIDAGSNSPMQEHLQKIVSSNLEGKGTFWFNHERFSSMENIYLATTKLCSDPNSIVVHLDADDAFINNKVLEKLKSYYTSGADLTIGSMLRTDKQKDYPVSFNPRKTRGGNVWQHLRSYKKHLFEKIPVEYFKINEEWIPLAEDWAFMVPLSEIAKHPVHIEEILYFYQPEKTDLSKFEKREEVIGKIIKKPSLKS